MTTNFIDVEMTNQVQKYACKSPAEIASGQLAKHPIVIVGAGPAGLSTAIDLALHNVPVVLLEAEDTVSKGSRGVCYAKRTIEIFDRLGVGDACMDQGVSWNVGRTFFRDQEVYSFNLLPQPDHNRPGMINLPQSRLEEILVRRAQGLPYLDLRFCNKVVSIKEQKNKVLIHVDTPDGAYTIESDWLVVADGARSGIRRQLGLEFEGKTFMDRFLIADVEMKADFPAERWFWFDPPFHRGQSVLLHHQSDNLWRIDFQLGWDVDPEEEKKPANVIPRIREMLGEEYDFELRNVNVYTFQCRRMAQFRHGQILFIGDAAHQVSPYGARGVNAGVQDADNLAWKLRLVYEGKSSQELLDTYSTERVFAADENLLNSTRSTDFITPNTKTSKAFRNAVLGLARSHPFARALVNSGRLSVPSHLIESPLNTPDTAEFIGTMEPGAPCADCPMQAQVDHFWLLQRLGGEFKLLVYVDKPEDLPQADKLQGLMSGGVPVEVIIISPAGGRSPHGFRVFADYTADLLSVTMLKINRHG